MSRTSRHVRPALTAVLLLAAPLAVAAQGRPLTVRGMQGLTIGNVIPGVPTVVPYTDAARAALFEIRGRNGTQVEVLLTLPATLAGAGGAAMPMTFGASAAGISPNGNAAAAVPRDPNVPFTVVITSSNGRVYLHLGGIAAPTGTQPAGAYAGTVLLTAAYTGI